MAVRNYAPEFLELFRRGAEKSIRVELSTQREATTLRFRLNNLRKEMRKERHSLLPIAEGVQMSIELGETYLDAQGEEQTYATLIVHPADNKFLDAIHRAGIEISEDEAREAEARAQRDAGSGEPLPAPEHSPEATVSAIDSFLKKD